MLAARTVTTSDVAPSADSQGPIVKEICNAEELDLREDGTIVQQDLLDL